MGRDVARPTRAIRHDRATPRPSEGVSFVLCSWPGWFGSIPPLCYTSPHVKEPLFYHLESLDSKFHSPFTYLMPHNHHLMCSFSLVSP